jgi:heptosyltransferase-1
MRVLLVKLSSLGDVVHSFPAISDAAGAIPGLEIDWLVDEAFAPLARLHPAIRNVISLPIRRLKKAPRATFSEMRDRIGELRTTDYDVLIDAQGLVKSAIAGRFAKARRRHGFARGSAREGLATLTYDVGHDLPETEHMATRIRRLFAAALGYPMPPAEIWPVLPRGVAQSPSRTIVLVHGTSWKTKTWTAAGWHRLAALCAEEGFEIVLFAHGAVEEARVAQIAQGIDSIRRMPPSALEAVIPVLASASGVVTVDTGLGHLAAAFGIPTVGLYGPTNPGLTGLAGRHVTELVAHRPCAPCEQTQCRIQPDFGEGPPCLADHTGEQVWSALQKLIRKSAGTS